MVPFYQINTYEDLEKLPHNEPFHVEIHLEAAVLPWKKLPGLKYSPKTGQVL